ncbi:zinc finger homeobox protein 4-like isoform X1 [Tachysurus ichikawai]
MSPKKVSGKNGSEKKKRMMTMEIKHEIVDKYERGARVSDLARVYDRPTSTICTILKQKDVIKNLNPSKGVTIISKLRSNINDEMEKLLLLWIKEKQMSGDTTTETTICEKASLIYGDLKKKEAAEEEETSTPGKPFKASRGWFDNFKKRTGIHSVVRRRSQDTTLVASEGFVPQQDFKMPRRTFITAEENKLINENHILFYITGILIYYK